MAKKRLVVGNWKMYVESPEEAKKLASGLRRRSRLFAGVEVAVAPPFTLLPQVAVSLKGSKIKISGQTVSAHEDQKHTGEVSAQMLKHAGASHVIVGHSERRALGESEEMIRAQTELAHKAGLVPIVCVGEQERDAAGSYFSLITEQLTSALKNFPKTSGARIVVAYEPVWAIGKSASEAMKPQELREMSIFIKKTLAGIFERKAAMGVPILYGGSVEPANARSLITEGDVSGFLVGHASAELDSFVEILKSCKK